MHYETIINFWFNELKPKNWFEKSDTLDNTIKDRFLDIHTKASGGELYSWRNTPEGRLAEVIILDQFSRNMFRDTANMFAFDPLALVLAQEAVRRGTDKYLSTQKKSFLYMPYMHSESLQIHDSALPLFQQPGLEGSYGFETKHRVIIEKFSRYPHRNEILARKSSSEEIDFLKQKNSSF